MSNQRLNTKSKITSLLIGYLYLLLIPGYYCSLYVATLFVLQV